MATYDEYEVQQLVKAREQQAEYEKQRRAESDKHASQVQGVYDKLITDANRQYNKSASDTAAAYREAYDANVVNEMIARRNAKEAIANAGMTNSGLNSTQQTAISLSRSNADAKVTSEKKKSVNAIMAELDAIRTKYNAQAAAEKSSIYDAAAADVLKNRQTLESAARDNAARLYEADVQAAQEAAQRELEQQTALYKAQQQSAKTAAAAKDSTEAAPIGYQRNTVYKAPNGNYMYNGKTHSKTSAMPMTANQIVQNAIKFSSIGNDAESVIDYIAAMSQKYGYTQAEAAQMVRDARLVQ